MERRRTSFVSLLAVLVIAACVPFARADETKVAEPAKKAADAKKLNDDDYELFQIFADTLDQVERNYVKDVSRRELMEAAIHGVLSKLDPYSNYISPEDISRFKTSVENQFGGIGIQIGMENGQLKVISPMVGTPAYRAGLEAGDSILEIGGATTEGIQIDEAVRRLKGEAGTDVTLTIRHPYAEEPNTVTITRELVHVETVLGDKRKSDDTWDFMLDHDRRIGYVRISGFSRDTAQDLKKVLVELQDQGLKGLVIDLRFNPGGLLTSAIDVSDLFVSDGRIVSTSGRNVPDRAWDAKKEGTFEGFPMAVLVNHFSASASEILSACLQDHKRAVVIGERTWGKASVQNVIELEGGRSALKLTTASYERPSGKNIHRFPNSDEKDEWGVMPNEGFDVKLSMAQTRRLIEYRHDRDILVSKHDREQAEQAIAAAQASSPEKPAAAEAKPEEPPAGEAADKPQAADSNADQDKPADDRPQEPTPQEPKSEESKPEEATPEEATPAAEPATNEAAADKEDDSKAPFVDVQLQKAVDYLTQELARAQ